MEELVRQEAANGAANHFQAILVDDAVDTDESCRQSIGFFQERNEVGNAAVDAVNEEDVERYEPDILVLNSLQGSLPGFLVGTEFFAVRPSDRLCFVRFQQEIHDDADNTGDNGIE